MLGKIFHMQVYARVLMALDIHSCYITILIWSGYSKIIPALLLKV